MSLLRHYSLLVIIILLGFGLRTHDLQAVPLRGDEAFSVLYWADTPLNVSLTEIAHGEPHTPLVYAVGRAWNYIIGGIDSVFALRYLSVLGNIIGVSAIFALGWRLSKRRSAALIAALMWALHPFEIWHSQEFRNYAYWGRAERHFALAGSAAYRSVAARGLVPIRANRRGRHLDYLH